MLIKLLTSHDDLIGQVVLREVSRFLPGLCFINPATFGSAQWQPVTLKIFGHAVHQVFFDESVPEGYVYFELNRPIKLAPFILKVGTNDFKNVRP